MGQLPPARLIPGRPFLRCGVDFCGSFTLRSMLARGSPQYKTYVAVFVCFTTKAIHLDVVSSLTTAAFIATLERFTGRRGKPVEIFSGNGTNFIGTDKGLARFLQTGTAEAQNDAISSHLSKQGIQWSFMPPAAPHFGGLWEAGALGDLSNIT